MMTSLIRLSQLAAVPDSRDRTASEILPTTSCCPLLQDRPSPVTASIGSCLDDGRSYEALVEPL